MVPEMDPFGGAQVFEKAVNSMVFDYAPNCIEDAAGGVRGYEKGPPGIYKPNISYWMQYFYFPLKRT